METLDNRIITFLKKMNLLTFCVSQDNEPYCANAFYAFDEEKNRIIIASSTSTKHIKIAQENPIVAINIALDTKVLAKIKGLQIKAKFSNGDENARRIYLQKYPFAKMLIFEIFVLDILWVKYVDNTLGFGKKIINSLA